MQKADLISFRSISFLCTLDKRENRTVFHSIVSFYIAILKMVFDLHRRYENFSRNTNIFPNWSINASIFLKIIFFLKSFAAAVTFSLEVLSNLDLADSYRLVKKYWTTYFFLLYFLSNLCNQILLNCTYRSSPSQKYRTRWRLPI